MPPTWAGDTPLNRFIPMSEVDSIPGGLHDLAQARLGKPLWRLNRSYSQPLERRVGLRRTSLQDPSGYAIERQSNFWATQHLM